jgi:uncharacterized SAM-binding protein YcdF (DUF218 family)
VTYTQPLLILFLLMMFIGVLRSRRGGGLLLPLAGLLGLFLLSWHPAAWLFSRHLEARYPVRPFPPEAAEAIVVLSSSASPPHFERPYPLPDKETYQRCEFASWLHKSWKPVPVLACGGPSAERRQPVSATMRQLLERAGVPGSMIWTEERSRSTYENAIFGAEVLKKHGISTIALVVEARAMRRAQACFQKAGFRVMPAPCEFIEFESLQEEFIPNWLAIKRNEDTLHETVGLAWYWLRGWI